jgi:2-methylisocitrate lyase-like PEP mutase family enzyme
MRLTQLQKAEKFRGLHARPGAFILPNPWDAGTARLLAAAGFEALTTTSAGVAFMLGKRDGAVTRAEALANARAIVDATDVPIAADLENGYGDSPQDAAETIRLAGEKAGVVSGSIEDASRDPRKPIYDFQHAVDRIAAAVEAARCPFHSCSSPALKTTCMAAPTWMTPFAAFRPSKPLAQTFYSPRESRVQRTSGLCAPRSPSR